MTTAALPTSVQSAISAVTEPVLIVGGQGMLARAVRELFEGRLKYRAATRASVDITQPQTLSEIAAGDWPLVINCAAWTDVDGAEKDEVGATRVNGEGVANLAAACCEGGVRLVHFSTDYVFNGRATKPYPTHQPRAPISAYGRSKAAGEEALERFMDKGLDALVLRTSWLYAPWGKNFVRTIAKLAKERPTLKVVSDQRGRPTSAEQLAQITVRMLAAGATGFHHAADEGECSWFEFAARIAAFANPACVVEPCTTAEFPRPAPRPAYSVLDLSKTHDVIGTIMPWETALDHVLTRLEA